MIVRVMPGEVVAVEQCSETGALVVTTCTKTGVTTIIRTDEVPAFYAVRWVHATALSYRGHLIARNGPPLTAHPVTWRVGAAPLFDTLDAALDYVDDLEGHR